MSSPITSTSASTRWNLVARPQGTPQPSDVERVVVELPELAAGEVRVANEFLSVDPYMRGRMNDVRSYIPPFRLGEPMDGGAVGRVVESRDESLPVGTPVLHNQGWRDVAQGPASAFRVVAELPGLPLSLHLHVLGLTGITAWTGLTRIAELREGDTVFVSGAAGGVGTMVGQIARLLGAKRVVGSAGTPEKVALLTEKYGYDAAFNYRDGDVTAQLAAAAPDGIDVFFDNVGGANLEAALEAFNDGGRSALCGAISGYNVEGDAGVRGLTNLITRGLRLQGFTMGKYSHVAPEFGAAMSAWLTAGEIAWDETVVDGIDAAFDAFTGMMRGDNIGKMLVRV